MDLSELAEETIKNKSISQQSLKLDQNEETIIQEVLLNIVETTTTQKNINPESLLSKDFNIMLKVFSGYMEQLKMNLSRISESVYCLSDEENCKRFKEVEITFTDALKIIETINKDIKDKYQNDDKEVCEKNYLERESLLEQKKKYDKELNLESLKLETSQLEDKIEDELHSLEKLIKEQRDHNRKLVEFIESDTTMNDKILQVEESLLHLPGELKDALKQNEENIDLSKSKKIVNDQNSSSQIEKKKEPSMEYLLNKTGSTKSLSEKENQLSECKSQTHQITKEIEQITVLQTSLEKKLSFFQQNIVDAEKNSFEYNFDTIIKDHEDLLSNSEKLLNIITESDPKIRNQIEQTFPHKKATKLTEKNKNMEEESHKNTELREEIDELQLRNEYLGQNIKHYETIIKLMTTHKEKMRTIREENQKMLKLLPINFEDVNDELGKSVVKKCVKPSPRTPQKLCNKLQSSQPKKRGISTSNTNNRCIEGETLNYAKKVSKENKKQKR